MCLNFTLLKMHPRIKSSEHTSWSSLQICCSANTEVFCNCNMGHINLHGNLSLECRNESLSSKLCIQWTRLNSYVNVHCSLVVSALSTFTWALRSYSFVLSLHLKYTEGCLYAQWIHVGSCVGLKQWNKVRVQ